MTFIPRFLRVLAQGPKAVQYSQVIGPDSNAVMVLGMLGHRVVLDTLPYSLRSLVKLSNTGSRPVTDVSAYQT